MVITQKPESLDTINCVKYNQKENKRQEGTAGSPHLRLRALTSRATPAPSAGEASVGVSESIYLTLRDFSVMCTKFFQLSNQLAFFVLHFTREAPKLFLPGVF